MKFNLCTLIWRSDFVSFFTIFSTGKDGVGKEYYSIDCILFLLKNVHLAHPLYVREAAVSWRTCILGPVNPFETRHEISNNVCATSKASDQPSHKRSLIRAFASHLNIL